MATFTVSTVCQFPSSVSTQAELNVFEQFAIDRKQIGDEADDDQLKSGEKTNSGGDEARHVRAGCSTKIQNDPARAENKTGGEWDNAKHEEKSQRTVAHKNAQDRPDGIHDVTGRAFH